MQSPLLRTVHYLPAGMFLLAAAGFATVSIAAAAGFATVSIAAAAGFATVSITAPSAVPAIEIAAKPDGLKPPKAAPEKPAKRKSGNAVIRVQKALSEMGLYLGPINGHLNEETEAAIRIYQKNAGIRVDGKVSRQLWDLLNNAVQVRSLLKRLDQARRSSKDKARRALLAHPATRDLVSEDNRERADPTRDPSTCFAEPTVRCLLDEASESVKAVFRPELRDWALGEVLVAQARAGLGQEAMSTAARIRDPRLIMVALRDIAEARAAAGYAEEALKAAAIIPDEEKRADALAAIAAIQVKRGDQEAARHTVARLIEETGEMNDPIKRISYRTRGATILAAAGDRTGAEAEIAEAEAVARAQQTDSDRSTALRYVAAALADMQRPGLALGFLDEIASSSERVSVLMSAATAQARAGDAAAALATADTIEAVRYRAVVLGRIAVAQAQQGARAASEATLELALAAVDEIDLPYARSYAVSRIALSMVRVGLLASKKDNQADTAKTAFNRAASIAERVDDDRLRAHTLWTIAADQRRAGDEGDAKATESLADAATSEIKSKLTRVWMFAEIAIDHARKGEAEIGWEAFSRGLGVGEKIDNAWGRARALAKLAHTLVELFNPGRGLTEE